MTALHTNADRRREDAVARILERIWRCNIHDLGDLNKVDRVIIRDGTVMAYAEIKCRNNSRHDFPTVFLPFRKWRDLAVAGWGCKCRTFFVWRWTDGIGYLEITNEEGEVSDQIRYYELSMAGRKDRGLNNDWEPMFLVQIDDVKWVQVDSEQVEMGVSR